MGYGNDSAQNGPVGLGVGLYSNAGISLFSLMCCTHIGSCTLSVQLEGLVG